MNGLVTALRPGLMTRTSSPFRQPLTEKFGFDRGNSLISIRKPPAGQTKILLMVPPYSRIEKECTESPVGKIIEMKRVGAPVGLLRVGTAAKNAGYDVKILDAAKAGFDGENILVPAIGLWRYGLENNEIAEQIARTKPHVIGITVDYTHQWGNVRELADLIKRIEPGIVVVLGGAHVTGDFKNSLMDSAADFVVLGEGDRTFVELVRLLEEKGRPEDVSGIAYRRDGAIILTRRRPFMARLSDIGVINYGLADLDLYSGPVHTAGRRKLQDGKCTHIFTSVGCNTRCGFCSIPLTNGPFRELGEAALDRQLYQLKKLGVSEVLVEDDNLLHNPFWALKVCELLKKHGFAWVEEGGVSLYSLIALYLGKKARETIGEEFNTPPFRIIRKAIDAGITLQDMINAMAESGCYSLYCAVESANKASLKIANKPMVNAKTEISLEIARMLERRGMKVTGGFMLGFAGPDYVESEEDVARTIDYARMLMEEGGMSFANPFIVTPLPGTPLGQYQMRFVTRDYDTGFCHELGTMDLPGSLSAARLEALRLRLLFEANGKERMRRMVESGNWPI